MGGNIRYHDAKGEAGDDGVLDGYGGELESADMAGEGLGDGAERVLADGGEDGRASKVPQLLGLDPKLLCEPPQSPYGLYVSFGYERRSC